MLCGTDVIEIERVKDSIERLGDKFLNEIFTQNEIEYCNSKKNMKYQHFAGRFAAKESIFKAVSELLDDKFEISWKNAEILNDEKGKPRAKLSGTKIDNVQIELSISHCKEYATAIAIIDSQK